MASYFTQIWDSYFYTNHKIELSLEKFTSHYIGFFYRLRARDTIAFAVSNLNEALEDDNIKWRAEEPYLTATDMSAWGTSIPKDSPDGFEKLVEMSDRLLDISLAAHERGDYVV